MKGPNMNSDALLTELREKVSEHDANLLLQAQRLNFLESQMLEHSQRETKKLEEIKNSVDALRNSDTHDKVRIASLDGKINNLKWTLVTMLTVVGVALAALQFLK